VAGLNRKVLNITMHLAIAQVRVFVVCNAAQYSSDTLPYISSIDVSFPFFFGERLVLNFAFHP
jgi:hypothetical protein